GQPPRSSSRRAVTNGSSSPYPARSRSASVSAVIASLRLRSLGQPVTPHRSSRRTTATISVPLIFSDMESSPSLIDMGAPRQRTSHQRSGTHRDGHGRTVWFELTDHPMDKDDDSPRLADRRAAGAPPQMTTLPGAS